MGHQNGSSCTSENLEFVSSSTLQDADCHQVHLLDGTGCNWYSHPDRGRKHRREYRGELSARGDFVHSCRGLSTPPDAG